MGVYWCRSRRPGGEERKEQQSGELDQERAHSTNQMRLPRNTTNEFMVLGFELKMALRCWKLLQKLGYQVNSFSHRAPEYVILDLFIHFLQYAIRNISIVASNSMKGGTG